MKKNLCLILLGVMIALFAYTAITGSALSRKFAGLVDIGGGRKMYLECQGDGSPTVVLVSGRTDRADIWQTPSKSGLSVFSEVGKFTRVCAYDRPGTVTVTAQNMVEPSRSSSVLQPTTPKKGVEDLHALLIAAKVPAPYVLVGHSYGGLIVRLYATTYPKEVVGLVLVDTLTEMLYDELSPSQRKMWVRLNSHYSSELDRYTIQERTDFAPSFEQLRAGGPVHVTPAIVLTSDEPYDFRALIAKGVLPADAPVDFGSVVFQAHLLGQERLARLLHAKHITHTHAGHYIQLEQPQLVIDAIREVVDKVRSTSNSTVGSLPSPFHPD